jgi:hypothetical protein
MRKDNYTLNHGNLEYIITQHKLAESIPNTLNLLLCFMAGAEQGFAAVVEARNAWSCSSSSEVFRTAIVMMMTCCYLGLV